MRHWQSWSSVEKLAAASLLVGGVLCGALWIALHPAPPVPRAPRAPADAVSAQPARAAAILPAIGAVSLPRACAAALRADTSKDTAVNNTDASRDDIRLLAGRGLAIPVAGVEKALLYDSFVDARGTKKHEAIDIHAPRGTRVIAAGDGCVVKLFRSIPGGITLYQFDPEGQFAYYYAHLDRYAENVKEGTLLRRGDTVGYVGTTGNAPADTPHLHFAIVRLGPEKRWWAGTAVNPYAVFTDP